MSKLLLFTYCSLALGALSESIQVNPGPKYFESEQSQNFDNRFPTHEITLYLTPDEMKSLENAQDSSSLQREGFKGLEQNYFQSYNDMKQEQQQQLKPDMFKNTPAEGEEQRAELRGLLSQNSFYPKESSSYEEDQRTYGFINSYANQNTKEEPKQMSYSDFMKIKNSDNAENQSVKNQENTAQKDFEWKPFNPESMNKEKALMQEELQKQWKSKSHVQLKGLSATQRENHNVKSSKTSESEPENASKKAESSYIPKSDLEKQIEAILTSQAFSEGSPRFDESEPIHQRPPIIIHKEISVTKHLPVHVVRHVKVPVPTPVLVPVPEPYQVKVPHPYPVPLEVVKHIPIPVVKHY